MQESEGFSAFFLLVLKKNRIFAPYLLTCIEFYFPKKYKSYG